MSGSRGPLDFGPEDREEPRDAPPPAEAPPPARPPGASRYGWFFGLVVVLLLAVVTLNSITSDGVRTGGPKAGKRLAPFAVPLAASSMKGDANVASKADQGPLGDTPACRVRGPEILNVCQLAETGPVVLALFPTDAARCRGVLRQFERLHARHPRVRFAAVGSRGDRGELRGDWSFPVGYDRDGAVASVYGLVGCPQITFARQGGAVVETVNAELTDAKLEARLRRLG